MIAVIELGGNQFNVRVGDVIDVKKMKADVDSKGDVAAMLISDEEGKDTKIGTPLVEGSKVSYKVLEQFKGTKVRVFKMKAKKRYMKNVGFRPHLTKIEIMSIA
ncbi:50S ribosomal protein L21 [Candidatus Gracilibacteria bacterium]|nr:50S ribosomal protein L21 [Candidatus Gracilibacteria bacterium]